jgi:hypothetical protein
MEHSEVQPLESRGPHCWESMIHRVSCIQKSGSFARKRKFDFEFGVQKNENLTGTLVRALAECLDNLRSLALKFSSAFSSRMACTAASGGGGHAVTLRLQLVSSCG